MKVKLKKKEQEEQIGEKKSLDKERNERQKGRKIDKG